jgi:hypothetical protein
MLLKRWDFNRKTYAFRGCGDVKNYCRFEGVVVILDIHFVFVFSCITFLSETFTLKSRAGSLFGKSLILHYVETVCLMFANI